TTVNKRSPRRSHIVQTQESLRSHTLHDIRFSSATRRNSLKVAVVKLKQGAGIIGDACPSTRGVESGGRRDPYSIETHPSNSVP
ncbi:unnamed protein product, partial [Callosobruchus maculatus]